MKLLLTLGIVLLLNIFQISAQQLIKTFYDFKKTKVKEEYFADSYGVKTGKYKEYSEFGGILVEGTYKNDIKTGAWKYKNGSANTTNIETYNDSGVENGLWLRYCEFNRKIKFIEGNYKDGKKDGSWTEYFCESDPLTGDQQIKKQETYTLGKLNGKCIYYEKKGERTEATISISVTTSEWKTYTDKGILDYTRTYGNQINGFDYVKIVVYYPDGKINVVRQIIPGPNDQTIAKLGEEIFYDSTGVVFAKNIWNEEKITDVYNQKMYLGSHEDYFSNGKLRAKCTLKYDRGTTYCVGDETQYYENGNKRYECKNDKNGSLIKETYIEYFEDGQINEKARR